MGPSIRNSIIVLGLVWIGHSHGTVRITEIHYHPLDSMFFQTVIDDGVFEFIELKNTGTQTVNLGGYAFVAGITYAFPAQTNLAAGKFLVLASDPYWFESRYGFAPFGQYSGQLSNSGETITLVNATGALVDQVTFSDLSPWPVAADGSGNSLVPQDSDRPGDPNSPATWRASARIHGSPGADDRTPSHPSVVVSEALTHTDPPQLDFVEIHNTGSGGVNIGGWYLTDNNGQPKRYRIPANTTIPAGGYLVFTEEHFNANPADPASFSFSSHGEEVFIFEADASGNLTGFSHGFKFGEIENGISFGRYVTSTGAEHFVAQTARTPGAANAGPLVGPLVISEIMYQPADPQQGDYLELLNISADTILLYDPAHPANTWRVDGIAFSFPPNIRIRPGEAILLVDDTTTAESFRSRHPLPPEVQVFSFSGNLRDDGETIRLEEPKDPYVEDTAIVVPYMLIDWVTYDEAAFWPTNASGTGFSLQRRNNRAYGNDPANWSAGQPTPGVASTAIRREGRSASKIPTEAVRALPDGRRMEVLFTLKTREHVRLMIYTSTGRHLGTLLDRNIGFGPFSGVFKIERESSEVLIAVLEIGGVRKSVARLAAAPLRRI